MDPHQPCGFHKNGFKSVICIVIVIIIISWKSSGVIFLCKLKNTHEVLLLESILIRKKILWRISLVFIKFSLNVLLLFEKSQNECKNLSFLHKDMCIESDCGSRKMRHCLSTFMALNSRRLCFFSIISFPELCMVSWIILQLYLLFGPVDISKLYWCFFSWMINQLSRRIYPKNSTKTFSKFFWLYIGDRQMCMIVFYFWKNLLLYSTAGGLLCFRGQTFQ